MTWVSWPTEEQIKQHDGLWMYRMEGYPKSLEIGSFERVDRPDDEPFWEWSNGSHKVTKDSASCCSLVKFAPVDCEGRLVSNGRKTPTDWLDITECDGGVCVAWNSARYILTDAQARKMRDTLSALMAGVVKD